MPRAHTNAFYEKKKKKKEREKKDLAKLLFLHTRLTYTDELLAHLPAHPYFNLMTSCLFILYMYKGLTWTRLFVLACVFPSSPDFNVQNTFFFFPFHVMFHLHYFFLGIELGYVYTVHAELWGGVFSYIHSLCIYVLHITIFSPFHLFLFPYSFLVLFSHMPGVDCRVLL
ncbi:hypothetical protein BDV33DRAFT_8272 [Aspergillus novoparasiticus]|uniref:Uncharacterized protein n=1 Tax=Aspergillus novoparasiticus TaxID=986946 RepID=A0A5N6EDV8_9EURO|nr:hypothetical protein BDV33DRAFT_8272 [Aspergillus novoparasiticus]